MNILLDFLVKINHQNSHKVIQGLGVCTLASLALGSLSQSALADLTITPSTNATAIGAQLTGENVTISGVTINQGNIGNQTGLFSGGATGTAGPLLGIANGVVLVTGDVNSADGPNKFTSLSTGGEVGPTSTLLGTIDSGAQHDTVELQFNVVPTGNTLSLDYVFASEEYNEYVCTTFNDAVGIFVSGPGITGEVNIARIDQNSAQFSINQINRGTPGYISTTTLGCDLTNSQFFVNNIDNYNESPGDTSATIQNNYSNVEYDGLTKPLSATLGVQPNQTYTIKVVTADIGDAQWDGAVFLDLIRSYNLDYGDAPNSYKTTSVNQAIQLPGPARHSVDATPLVYLGSVPPDVESNGIAATAPNAANGDDSTGDDEDVFGDTLTISSGITSHTISNIPVRNTSSTTAKLMGWIDFNQDGDFLDTGEQSTVNVAANQTTANLNWSGFASLTAGNTYARFRITTDTNVISSPSSAGLAIDGEVEDYQVAIAPYDYGDAPDSYGTNSTNDNGEGFGANHAIVNTLKLGTNAPDAEADAQTPLDGTGDGLDEDGISTFPSLNTNNTSYSLTAKVNNTTGSAANVYAWLDFDHDGKFDGDERATVSNDTITLDSNSKVPTGSNGTVTLTWNNLGSTGANIIDGNSYARIRLTTDNLSAASATTTRDSASVGNATNGEVEDYPIAIAPNTPLPPNDTSFKFCPAPTTETNYSDYRIAWTYNVPNNTLLPDHQPWPNKQYDATQIARASAQVIGSGMTYSFDADKQTVIRLSGVNQSDATSAYANGDYIEYQLTTNNTMDLERLFNGIAFAKHNYIQNYKIGIIFSKDNFATASTLLSDYTVQASAGGYEWTPIVTNQPIHLEPNTTYKFRILFYGATNPSTVYWDDLHLSMGGCQDFSDAPTTNYGAASHGLPPMVTYYLGTNKPDAESGVRDGGDGGVNADGDDTGGNTPDDEDGLVIPTLQQGKLTTVDVKVNGANGYLQAWFDWDGDSNFTTLGEQIATNVQDGSTSDLDGLVNGTIQLAINVPANATTTQTYARFRWSSSQNVNLIDRTGDGEVEDYQIAIAQASNPNLLLVKRITAINPGQPSAIQFDNFIDDIDTLNDNNSKWPDSNSNHNDNINAYLRGVSNYSAVKPGDEVEYTIYFLSNGDVNAKEVKICDAVPDHMTFVKNTYGVELGIGLGFDSTALPISLNLKLSNLLNDDQGDFYGAGTAPPIDLCKKVTPANTLINVNGTNNTNGAVVVELGNLPKANSPGSPTDSYGFIRFRGKVK